MCRVFLCWAEANIPRLWVGRDEGVVVHEREENELSSGAVECEMGKKFFLSVAASLGNSLPPFLSHRITDERRTGKFGWIMKMKKNYRHVAWQHIDTTTVAAARSNETRCRGCWSPTLTLLQPHLIPISSLIHVLPASNIKLVHVIVVASAPAILSTPIHTHDCFFVIAWNHPRHDSHSRPP